VALAAITLAGAGEAQAQEPAKPVLALDGDVAMITLLIRPDKTADFESVFAKYKEALGKSDKPARKEQLAGIKAFKSGQSGPKGEAIYILMVDPVVKGEEYDLMYIINEVFPSEVQALFAKYKDAFAGRGIAALSKVQ
jgi:hypothetical protein